uniref:Allatostatin CCC (AST-CCC) n=2 Tax=Lygus hesperus TaxID=30085 RepID=A0A7T7VNL4_LYGHE|nr:allatostatin CCC (AST-CCC) precursor [Lygus hesperus]
MLAKASIGPVSVAGVIAVLAVLALAAAHPSVDKDKLMNELELVDDDGAIDPAAVMNNIFIQRMLNRMRAQQDFSDLQLQRKRSYWKQCAFNAVSCFGK